jgi:hypothetical protein
MISLTGTGRTGIAAIITLTVTGDQCIGSDSGVTVTAITNDTTNRHDGDPAVRFR